MPSRRLYWKMKWVWPTCSSCFAVATLFILIGSGVKVILWWSRDLRDALDPPSVSWLATQFKPFLFHRTFEFLFRYQLPFFRTLSTSRSVPPLRTLPKKTDGSGFSSRTHFTPYLSVWNLGNLKVVPVVNSLGRAIKTESVLDFVLYIV